MMIGRTRTKWAHDYLDYCAKADDIAFLAADTSNFYVREALTRMAESYRVLAVDAAQRRDQDISKSR